MRGDTKRPHDRLFRSVFADPHEAATFLRPHLPPALVERFDWSSLALEETSFVDQALQESESDLLYTVQGKTETHYLYVLFEHQSSPDKWMRFRLLKYMCRIWDESFKKYPGQGELRPILPVVFYQGESCWHHSTEFADLFDASHQSDDFLPRFAHFLIDQSDLPVEQTQGGLKARVAQLLMMAAFQKSTRRALQHAAELLAQVVQTGGTDYIELFVVYLVATQEQRLIQEFVENLQQHTVDIGGEMLTYAEELKQAGRQEGLQAGRQEGLQAGRQEGLQAGRQEGAVSTIDSLLSAGVEWTLITKATGITPQQFQALKEQLRQLSSSN